MHSAAATVFAKAVFTRRRNAAAKLVVRKLGVAGTENDRGSLERAYLYSAGDALGVSRSSH